MQDELFTFRSRKQAASLLKSPRARQVIVIASISGDGSEAVSQGAEDVVWGSSWDATMLLAVGEANNFPLGGR